MQSGQYTWRTVQDGKSRSSHAARAGKVFAWNDPPEGGHPGQDYNCRCWAEEVKKDEERCKWLYSTLEILFENRSQKAAEALAASRRLEKWKKERLNRHQKLMYLDTGEVKALITEGFLSVLTKGRKKPKPPSVPRTAAPAIEQARAAYEEAEAEVDKARTEKRQAEKEMATLDVEISRYKAEQKELGCKTY